MSSKCAHTEEKVSSPRATQLKPQPKTGAQEKQRLRARDFMRRRRLREKVEKGSPSTSGLVQVLYNSLAGQFPALKVKQSSPAFYIIYNKYELDDGDMFWLLMEPTPESVREAQDMEVMGNIREPEPGNREFDLERIIGAFARRELDSARERLSDVTEIVDRSADHSAAINSLVIDWKIELARIELRRQRIIRLRLQQAPARTQYIQLAHLVQEWAHRRALYQAEAIQALEAGASYFIEQASANRLLGSESLIEII